MKRIALLLPLLVIMACKDSSVAPKNPDGPAANPSTQSGKEIVSINGTAIREGYLEFLARINPKVKSQLDNPATRKKIIDKLVEEELLYQESVKKGFDKNSDVLEKASLYKRIAISQAVVEDALNAESKSYYDKNRDTEFTKVSFSQILVAYRSDVKPELKKDEDKKGADKKPEEAKKDGPVTPEEKDIALKKAHDIKAKIVAGADFAKVAEESSDDKISKKKGGDMGAVSRGDKRLERLGMTAVNEAVFKIKVGQLSDPIETQKGYVIVKVTSDPVVTPFDEADRVIRFQIQQKVRDDLIKKLKESSKVAYAEVKDETKTPDAKKEKDPAPEKLMPLPVGDVPPPMAVPPAGTISDTLAPSPKAPEPTGDAPDAPDPEPTAPTEPADSKALPDMGSVHP